VDDVAAVAGLGQRNRAGGAAVINLVRPAPASTMLPDPAIWIVSLPAPVVIALSPTNAMTVSVPPIALITSPDPLMRIE